MEEYFALGYVPDPRTIFAAAKKLPPAHTLTVRRGQPPSGTERYWDPSIYARCASWNRRTRCDELAARLDESVRLRLISEVPLGAFLSGGVDSSAVVASMAKTSTEPVNTCSIAFADPAFDESRFAQIVADRYHTRHFVDRVESDDFDLIDVLARLYDEPYADSSAIPTYRVCQLARRHVTVALSGDGGDENFGGYGAIASTWPKNVCGGRCRCRCGAPLFGALGRAYPKADWAPRIFRAKSTFEALARDSVDAYFHGVSILRDDMRDRLFSATLQGAAGGLQRDRGVPAPRRHGRHRRSAGAVQYLDLKTYLVGDINTKVDRASMAHSLEVREPLMDHPLVEWLASLPSSLKVREGEGKYLLKKAMEPRLPAEVLYRPKMGFAVPLARWFRGPLRERVRDALLGERLAAHRLLRPAITWPPRRPAPVRALATTARRCGRCSCSMRFCATSLSGQADAGFLYKAA